MEEDYDLYPESDLPHQDLYDFLLNQTRVELHITELQENYNSKDELLRIMKEQLRFSKLIAFDYPTGFMKLNEDITRENKKRLNRKKFGNQLVIRTAFTILSGVMMSLLGIGTIEVPDWLLKGNTSSLTFFFGGLFIIGILLIVDLIFKIINSDAGKTTKMGVSLSFL